MLQALLSPILAGVRWLGVTAGPWLLSSFVSSLLVKLGIAVVSAGAVIVAFNTVMAIAISQVSTLSGAFPQVVQLLALFGVFEGLSLIASVYLAKLTWLAAKPSLTLFQAQQ